MCSIGEEDFGDEGGLHSMMQELAICEDAQGICKKCGIVGFVIKLTFREPECKECFLAYVRHKFRAALGSSKILPKNAKVLLEFDGGAESIVLLDMIHYAQSQNNFKRLHCSTQLLFIDDNQLIFGDKQISQRQIDGIAKFLKQYNTLNAFITNIGSSPSKFTNFTDFSTYSNETNEKFLADFKAMRSLTSRQDFIRCKRIKILAEACSYLGCDFIFTSDISNSLAAQLLTDVSLGRGGSVALNVSLVDDSLPGVKIVRPQKDLNAMEVKFYLEVRGLRPLKQHGYGDNFDSSASIQNLTKAFMENLQKNFSSTVSTVFRTGDKIANNRPQPNDDIANINLSICALCNSSVDNFNSKTLLATEFSRVVSERGTKSDSCKTLEEIATNNLNDGGNELCYACKKIKYESVNKLNAM